MKNKKPVPVLPFHSTTPPASVGAPFDTAPCGLAGRALRVHNLSVEPTDVQQRAMQLYSAGHIRQVVAGLPGAYRARILRVELVMMAMLLFVLDRVPSFMELYDRLTKGLCPGLPIVEVSASAFYKRLQSVSHEVFLALLRETTGLLRMSPYKREWVSALAPFATRILAIDDTTLDALARKAKWLKGYAKGAMATLGGRLGCALDLTTGCFAEVLYEPDAAANEKNHIRPLVQRLGAGALYVFDLGYFSFPLFDYLTEGCCYFISRLRGKTSFKVVQTLVETPRYRDRIVFLGKYRADRAAHPVRLVEILIGTTWYRYITNVLDPNMLPADRLWALYSLRWSIELSFAAVKRALNMAFLRACHQNGVLIQIWCTLTVYQVLQHLRLEIAARNGWQEDELSWKNLMVRIGWYLGRPDASRDLRQWMLQESANLSLKKRGVRKRRDSSLPSCVLDLIVTAKPPPVDLTVAPRTARQSKPEPRPAGQPIIEARLS